MAREVNHSAEPDANVALSNQGSRIGPVSPRATPLEAIPTLEDPYHKWLGIPPEQQPPNHYQLLGLTTFESDRDTIDNLANLRMAYVGTLLKGPCAQVAQQILDELAAARLCLLDRTTKAAYDAQLRSESLDNKRPPIKAAKRVAVAVAGLVIAVLMMHLASDQVRGLLGGNDGRAVSQKVTPRQEKKTLSGESAARAGAAQTPERVQGDAEGHQPGPDRAASDEQRRKPLQTALAQALDEDDVVAALSATDTPARLGDQDGLDVKVQVLPQESAKKLPVPPEDAQQKVLDEVKQLFKDEYLSNAASDKRALAGRLFHIALPTKDDPTARYVLLAEAARLAAEASDIRLSFDAVEQLAKGYEIDPLDHKRTVLSTAHDASQSTNVQIEVAQAAMDLTHQAVLAENYEIATGLMKLAAQAARETRDRQLIRQVRTRSSELEELRSLYETAKEAAAILEQSPQDVDAHVILGKYLCLVKGDWDRGLSHLAASADPRWKPLADLEQTKPAEADSQLKLADLWSEIAEEENGTLKDLIHNRARYWYEQAFAELEGFTKVRVAERLELLERPETWMPTIDLLRLIQPSKDAVVGDWKVVGAGLVIAAKKGFNRLQIPYLLPSEYILKIVLRAGPPEPRVPQVFVIGLANEEFREQITLDQPTPKGPISYLESEPPIIHRGAVLNPNKVQTVICAVRHGSIQVGMDGAPIIQRTGNSEDLRANPQWLTPDRALYIGTSGGSFRILAIELTPISGRGRPLR